MHPDIALITLIHMESEPGFQERILSVFLQVGLLQGDQEEPSVCAQTKPSLGVSGRMATEEQPHLHAGPFFTLTTRPQLPPSRFLPQWAPHLFFQAVIPQATLPTSLRG